MAKKYSGGIGLGTSLKIQNPSPVADYMVVELISDLTNTTLLPNQFTGMTTFVLEDQNIYTKKSSGWEISGGASFTGGTVTGSTVFTSSLSANTISATTYNGYTPLNRINNLSDVSNAQISLQNLGGLPILTQSGTGVSLSFSADTIYGTISSPESGTSITFITTNAKLGVTNIIIHNNPTTAPTFATNMKKLSGSSTYVINVINYIYVTFINDIEIIYSINQRT